MPYQNISASLSDTQKISILQHITDIEALLPFAVNLTPVERRTVPKMGEGTEPFVSKSLNYAEQTPTLAPPYLNVPELRKDMELTEQLTPIRQRVAQLFEKLEDTIMALGSEAFVAALSFYNSVKQASKTNVPGANAIYEDLRTRFPGGGGNTPPPTP